MKAGLRVAEKVGLLDRMWAASLAVRWVVQMVAHWAVWLAAHWAVLMAVCLVDRSVVCWADGLVASKAVMMVVCLVDSMAGGLVGWKADCWAAWMVERTVDHLVES